MVLHCVGFRAEISTRPSMGMCSSRIMPCRIRGRKNSSVAVRAASGVEEIVYPGTVLVTGASSAALTIKPAVVHQLMTGAALVATAEGTCQMIGVLTLPLFAAAYRCYLASKRDNLKSDTYQRLTLMLGGVLAAHAGAMLTTMPFNTLPVLGKVFVSTMSVLGLGLAYNWFKYSSRPAYLLKDIMGTVGDVLAPPSNIASAFYTALTIAATAAGISVLAQTGIKGQQIVFGSRILAMAVIAYTLKNGADRNRLERGTFKLLNESIAIAAAIAAGFMYKASETITPIVGGLAAVAASCAFIRINPGAVSGGSNTEGSSAADYKYQNIDDPMDALCSDDPDAEECKVFDS